VWRWREADPNFASEYARARDEGMDRLAELAADEACAKHAPHDVQAARLALDARKWFASKVAPRRYGDKLEQKVELSGPGGGPIQVEALHALLLQPQVLDRLNDAQVEALRSAIPLLAAPVVEGTSQVVEGVVEAVATNMASMAATSPSDVEDASECDDPDESTPDE
jgi:hypothetical protein